MAIHSSNIAWKIPWQRGLTGYNLWGCKESDRTEQLYTHITPYSKWCQPTHKPLLWNASSWKDACAHMGGSWDILNMDSEPVKSKWLAKGNLEQMSHVSDLNYHSGSTFYLSPLVCLSMCTLFFLISTLLVSLLSISMWKYISVCWWARALSLGTGV